ncbi:hypothetical protein K0M31_004607 [Melipona bicolor]|uniref:Uncharacterized protein n=1 Tax=Melipona bicolor TaxID=60889 RepID=A0AA40FX36_9HYME|nr:hypothetical protein K0M31_004607 [Melipona bicolor]
MLTAPASKIAPSVSGPRSSPLDLYDWLIRDTRKNTVQFYTLQRAIFPTRRSTKAPRETLGQWWFFVSNLHPRFAAFGCKLQASCERPRASYENVNICTARAAASEGEYSLFQIDERKYKGETARKAPRSKFVIDEYCCFEYEDEDDSIRSRSDQQPVGEQQADQAIPIGRRSSFLALVGGAAVSRLERPPGWKFSLVATVGEVVS